MLEPEKLINPRAKTGDGALELRETEHFYLDLSKLEPDVKKFLKERADHMRDTVIGESLGKIEAEGLKPRPITRDLDWGIPVPVEGWEGKSSTSGSRPSSAISPRRLSGAAWSR